MCQYANVPIGCAIMPHGNWHIGILAHWHIGTLAYWHIGKLLNWQFIKINKYEE